MSQITRRENPFKWLGQPGTAQHVVPASAGFLPVTRPLLHGAWLHNRSVGALAAAIVALVPDSMWEAGQWTNATTTYTPDTTDFQDAGADDAPLEVAGAAGDGFVVGCDVPFGALSLDITTAGVGAGTVHVVEYWNGSAWTPIAATGMLVDIPRTAGQNWTAGEALVLFDPKTDWRVGGSGTNVSATRYNLRIRATTAPATTAALAKRLYVGDVLDSVKSLAAGGVHPNVSKYHPGILLPEWTAGLAGAFGTADDGNTLELVRP